MIGPLAGLWARLPQNLMLKSPSLQYQKNGATLSVLGFGTGNPTGPKPCCFQPPLDVLGTWGLLIYMLDKFSCTLPQPLICASQSMMSQLAFYILLLCIGQSQGYFATWVHRYTNTYFVNLSELRLFPIFFNSIKKVENFINSINIYSKF